MTVLLNSDFEEGDFSEYDANVTNGGDLSVAAAAALVNTSWGLSNLVNDATPQYVQKNVSSTTGVIRARLYIDPNNISINSGDGSAVVFFYAVNQTATDTIYISKLMNDGSGWALRNTVIDDGGVHRESSLYPISDAPHWIETKYTIATTGSSNDAKLETWIDGVQQTSVTGVDSFTRYGTLSYIIIGKLSVNGTVSGTYYTDQIVVNDDGETIGPMPDVANIATVNETAGTSLAGGAALNMPSGIDAGDLLIAYAANDNTGGTNMDISGWTNLFHTQYTGNVISHGAWAKIATGGDTATLTGASQDYTAEVLRITSHGVRSIATDIKVGTAATGSDANPNPPNLDAGSSKRWLWIASAGADDDDNNTPYAPTNYVPIVQLESAQSTSSCMLDLAYRTTNAQSENPGTFTMAATEEWIANVIAIPPVGRSMPIFRPPTRVITKRR